MQHAALSPLPGRWRPIESVLRPASPQASAVHGLWDFMLIVSVIVYVLVMAAALYAVWCARQAARDGTAIGPDPAARDRVVREEYARTRSMRRVLTGAGALTVLTLFTYLLYDFSVGRANAIPLHDPQALHIRIVGHQWWWEVQYQDTAPHHLVTTANEIHVPVGRPVIFQLESADVIHSFWIPNLNGKKDLVPGHVNYAWFTAVRPGIYRGQCAEFCGYEHAKMAVLVIAQPAAQFNGWYAAQLRPAAPPPANDSIRVAGERVFLAGPCALCHTIEGTMAGGRTGPTLTHLASRLTLAAGMLPNTRGNLAGWIADPQRIKPGALMPPNALSPRDLRALLAYLGGLQ